MRWSLISYLGSSCDAKWLEAVACCPGDFQSQLKLHSHGHSSPVPKWSTSGQAMATLDCVTKNRFDLPHLTSAIRKLTWPQWTMVVVMVLNACSISEYCSTWSHLCVMPFTWRLPNLCSGQTGPGGQSFLDIWNFHYPSQGSLARIRIVLPWLS